MATIAKSARRGCMSIPFESICINVQIAPHSPETLPGATLLRIACSGWDVLRAAPPGFAPDCLRSRMLVRLERPHRTTTELDGADRAYGESIAGLHSRSLRFLTHLAAPLLK